MADHTLNDLIASVDRGLLVHGFGIGIVQPKTRNSLD